MVPDTSYRRRPGSNFCGCKKPRCRKCDDAMRSSHVATPRPVATPLARGELWATPRPAATPLARGECLHSLNYFLLFQRTVMADLVRHRAKQFVMDCSQLFRKHFLARAWVNYVFLAWFVIYIYRIQMFRQILPIWVHCFY